MAKWTVHSGGIVTSDQCAHLQRILTSFQADATAKYVNGQREHGGNLWEKPGMLEAAIQEAIDQVIYLYTLKEQRDAVMTTSKPEPSAVTA